MKKKSKKKKIVKRPVFRDGWVLKNCEKEGKLWRAKLAEKYLRVFNAAWTVATLEEAEKAGWIAVRDAVKADGASLVQAVWVAWLVQAEAEADAVAKAVWAEAAAAAVARLGKAKADVESVRIQTKQNKRRLK
jgi:hypothetical protein